MPYPSQITHDKIVETAVRLVEERGVEYVTLNEVAGALGVKTPSLYRYVRGRTDLLREVNLHFLNGLFATINQVTDPTGSQEGQMLGVMNAYRHYAHEHPRQYLMSFAYMVDELRPDEDTLLQLVLPIQAVMAAIAGPKDSLAALRAVLAYVHGFVMLELTDQLRRGGDLTSDFLAGAHAVLRGWRTGI